MCRYASAVIPCAASTDGGGIFIMPVHFEVIGIDAVAVRASPANIEQTTAIASSRPTPLRSILNVFANSTKLTARLTGYPLVV
jgi:hypothetical protein